MSESNQTVFVTGASGFVGSAIARELLTRGYSVRGLVHDKPLKIDDPRVQSIKADLFDPKSIAQSIAGCIAVIHVVGIIMEKPSAGRTFHRMHVDATASVLEATKSAGVRRYIHMSALGSRENAISTYHKTKWAAETLVLASGLDYTIFRPSLIHGPGGEFMQMEAAWARKKAPPFLFMPYFGAGILGTGGAGKLQPVYVGDVARAFVDAIEKPVTIGKAYALAGPDQITWPELHRISSQAIVGKKRLVMALPAWKAKLLATILPTSLLGFNKDQVIMSQEENTADITEMKRDFGWEPVSFVLKLAEYAPQLKRV